MRCKGRRHAAFLHFVLDCMLGTCELEAFGRLGLRARDGQEAGDTVQGLGWFGSLKHGANADWDPQQKVGLWPGRLCGDPWTP